MTWRLDRNGFREVGHYLTDYSAAKRDFAIRSGMIDRDRLFTETEMRVIRSNLSAFISLDGGEHISWEQEEKVKGVIEKIDNVIVPEMAEQTQEAEEEDEQEYD